MKTKSMTILGAAGLLLAAALPIFAHHSFSAEFDVNKPVKLEGTVVKMDWVNPHTWLYLDVTKPDGTVEHWQVEGGAPGVLLRNGWTKNTLAPGTKIIVNGHQAKDGAFRANSTNIQFPDGRKLDSGSSYGKDDKKVGLSGGQSPELHTRPSWAMAGRSTYAQTVVAGRSRGFPAAGRVFSERPRGVERSLPAP